MTAITGHFSSIMLGLTPVERLDALSRYHSDPTSHRLFVIIGLTIIGILTILLLLSVYRRKKSIQPVAGVFDEYADARNLSDHEYRILMNMAVGAKLKRTEFIFTLPSVFDRQSALMIEDTQAAHGIEESLKLQTQLDLLREKLNFRHYTSPDELMVTDAETQSTRQIPLKKKLFIKRNHRTSNGDLEAVVLENTTEGLMVQFKRPVEIVFGQPWVCRCYTGGLVAEFNTTVLRCSVQQAVLAHSDHVRLINRRRFLRVPMQQPAYIAKFPFKKETPEDDLNGSTPVRRQTLPAENPFEPPQFVPATVIELGGPGLRIRTTLKLTVGERILLMFKLDQHQKTAASSEEAGKIIEHIAVVRHLIDDQNDAVAALELVGLNDDGIDELIRVTNEASIKLNKWRNSYQQTQNTDPQTLPV